MLVGSLAFLAVAVCLPSQTFIGRAANYFAFNLATTGRMGIDIYEKSGPSALETFLGRIETISAFKLHISDARGRSLRARALPEAALSLVQRAMEEGSVQAQNWTSHPIIAQQVLSRSGQPYVVLLELPAGLVQLLSQMSHALLLRFAAALAASGLVCFLMVRYLTAPIRKLQAAVRKLAQGDLSVRVAPKMGSRQDEIADLGRDFDGMAARIETLMNAHEQLLRDVAHELRSPLTRLNVALEIARKHGNSQMTSYLDRIAIEALQLSRLITQVLTLSRLENIAVELHLEPLCLERLIQRIVHDANFESQAKDFSVVFHFQQRVDLNADGRLLHSAIENVVRNALRFSPREAKVEINQTKCICQGKPTAMVTISDRGPGVPPEALEDLFNPFFRVTDKPGRTSGGAGIGLAIAFRAVSLHGGTILAKNRDQGGLIIEIRLPLSPEESRSGTGDLAEGCTNASP